ASLDGAILVGAIWVLSRLLRLTPATRTLLWWCAAAKFVVALAWTTPVDIPILPAQTAASTGIVLNSPSRAAVPHDVFSDPGASRALRAERPLWSSLTEVFREWSTFAAIGWTVGLVAVALVGLHRWRDTTRMRDE